MHMWRTVVLWPRFVPLACSTAGTQGGNGSTSASSLQCRQLVISSELCGAGGWCKDGWIPSWFPFTKWEGIWSLIKFPKSLACKLQFAGANPNCCQWVVFLLEGWRESSLWKTMIFAKLKFSKFTPANCLDSYSPCHAFAYVAFWSHQWLHLYKQF